MDKSELESKYHKLATEYSKVRSHATVLKKAVLDEQATILNLKETIKEQEQKIRKHDQEMESLTFRNEQLSKRILVLQQELQVNSHGKKSKSRGSDIPNHSNFSVIDEELHKKIIENAQLASAMADKDLELENYKEKMIWMEEKLIKLQNDLSEKSNTYNMEIAKMKSEKQSNHPTNNFNKVKDCQTCKISGGKSISHWEQEADRWKAECDVLRSKPVENEELTEYYESQIRQLIETKQMCQAEAGSFSADNEALTTRLERLTLERNALESILDKSNEELHTTSENYRTQLDAMTEHLAAQNEKITKQCDEIQILKHKLSLKK